MMKQISLAVVLIFLLAACGLNIEDVPTDGLTSSIGSGSQSVVMSGGSTMLQKYYEGTVATGGLVTAVSEIVGCEAVFEPNDQNGRIFVQLRPKGNSDIFGEGTSPQFSGGGLLTQLTVSPEMSKESFRASCEGLGRLTAVPVQVDGQLMWLASVDLSRAVWKAPAGTEVSEFFSEDGHQVMLLMTTDTKVDVPETAVAYAYDLNPNDLYNVNDSYPKDLDGYDIFRAYDLNPNDLSVTDPQCSGVLLTSDADIGPIARGIMFETLIGTSGMLVLGDGNALSNQGTGVHPFTCEDSSKVQMRSADLGLGDASYKLVELHYPEITLQTADGGKVTLTDVIILGVVPHTIAY